MNIDKLLNTKNIVKYLIFAGIVFSLIKIIPRTPLNNTEKSILLIVSLTALIGLDCVLPTTENFSEKDDTVVVMGKVLNDMDIKKNVVDVINERNGDYPTKLLNLTRILKNSKFSNKLLENMIKEGIINDKELKILSQNQALPKEQLQELVKNKVLKPEVLETISKDIITVKPKVITKLEKVKEDIKRISKLLQGEGIENEEALEEELRNLEKSLEQKENRERQTVRQTERQEERQTERQEERQTERQEERQAERQEERHAERQEDKQEERQEERKRQIEKERQIVEKEIEEEERQQEERLRQRERQIEERLRQRERQKEKERRDFESKLKEQEASLKRLKEKRDLGSKLKKDDSDMKYNELPEDFLRPIGEGLGKWSDNEYTILNTDKWRVPMPRPPVCISSSKPCEPCPLMTDGYPMNLKEWDNSRKVTNIEINKKWANDQLDSQ
jgi:hypothetical protein